MQLAMHATLHQPGQAAPIKHDAIAVLWASLAEIKFVL
jgi:hypothetical protein